MRFLEYYISLSLPFAKEKRFWCTTVAVTVMAYSFSTKQGTAK